MPKKRLDERTAEAAVLGGAVLGGGAGGSVVDGLERARMAVRLGSPMLITSDELGPEDQVVVACMVGSSAGAERYIRPVDHLRAMELLLEKRPAKPAGIVANENGAGSSVNGWLQAAFFGIPVVDAPANGRACPSGLMGAMGLHRVQDYTSIQAAAGGDPGTDRYLEVVVEGSPHHTSNMMRLAAAEAGGAMAVVRDPVAAKYLREYGAIGGTSHAIRLGEAIMAARDRGAQAVMGAITSTLGGSVLFKGEVSEVRMESTGGYDTGTVILRGQQRCDLSYWNGFMTAEIERRREGTFPDLITMLSQDDGMPIAGTDAKPGQKVAVLLVSRINMILGEGVRMPELLREAEEAVGKRFII